MNAIAKIGNENVPVIEWKGQRVITTSQLAKVYGTHENNVKNNFSNHKDRFVNGKHYFLLQGEELKELKRVVNDIDLPIVENLKFTSQLYLWTERGADRHCKILDTDKAWEQFDNLEKCYFNRKKLMTTAEQIRLLAQGNVELGGRVDKVESRIATLENDTPLYGCEIDEVQKHVRRKGVNVLGGKQSEAYRDGSVRSQVYSDIYSQLKREYGCVSSYKSIKRKYISDVHDFIDCYTPPRALEELISDTNAQMGL